jgi:hypothetical protein
MKGADRALARGSAQGLQRAGAARVARFIGPLLLAVVFVALAAWTWKRTADVLIDFGNELYVAWRLASGDALYRDIATRNGPLSHAINAAWFLLFGVSVRTLVLCNLAVLAGTCALVWRVFAPVCGRAVALATGLTLLAAFGFAHTLDIGNYNWVTPYQHAQTHGLVLAIAGTLALAAALRSGRPLAWGLAGLCLGLVFLTKAELFVPFAGAAALALVLEAGAPAPRPLRAASWLALAAALPVLVAFAVLSSRMTPLLAVDGVLGNWSHLAGIAGDPFYRARAGLDAPWSNALRALRALGILAAFAAACAAIDLALPRRGRAFSGALAAATLFALLVSARHRIAWHELARALPLTSAIGLVALLAACWRRRGCRVELAQWAGLALWAALSLGLLAKTGLAARIDHYGFALAMPATLLLVAGLTAGLPRGLPAGRGAVAGALAAAAIAAALVAGLGQSAARLAPKQLPVGRGADQILAARPPASLRGERVAQALARLEALLPADATLLVLPEGAGLNYWLRRRNPSRYLLFLPTEIAAYGEAAMLADLAADPPDFAVLAHRDAGEFGVGPFGRDPRNGQRLRAWLDAHYERVARIGPEPFGSDGFGLVILRRRPGPGASVHGPVEPGDAGMVEVRDEAVAAGRREGELGQRSQGSEAAVGHDPLGSTGGPSAPLPVVEDLPRR